MRKCLLLSIFLLLTLIMAQGYAFEKQVSFLESGMEVVINYAVNESSPQFISFAGLSPSRTYSLECYPYTNLSSPQEVDILVWSGKKIYSGTFGGIDIKPITFYGLTPFLRDTQSYAIEYQLSARSYSLQKGTCVFK